MSFQSFAFLAFLPAVLAVCLTAGRRSRTAAAWLLLAACAVFYGPGGLLPVLVLGLGVQVLVRRIHRSARPKARRALYGGGVCLLAGALALSKYLAAGNAAWAAPLGLSFFTFQQIWYLSEVYRGRFAPAGGRDWALYALFFPTVSSGPILKPQAFFPQLAGEGFLRPGWDGAAAGLFAFCRGMGKKVLLADAFGVVVNNGWAALNDLSAPGAWLVILGYTLQLYFDFSGYCDMAAGCARLLGVRLPLNFDSPYRSLSVGEFWKRWHITLTSFLRECLYFPLGGSRRGTARTYGNILLVFLVSGLWHGTGWTFVVWGLLHGLAQVAERAWGPGRDRLPKPLRWGGTFLFVNLAWVFFRAPSLSAAGAMLSAAVSGGFRAPVSALAEGLFSGEATAVQTLLPALSGAVPLGSLAVLFAAGLTAALWPRNTVRQMDAFRPGPVQAAACAALLVWSVLSFAGGTTFIYANF